MHIFVAICNLTIFSFRTQFLTKSRVTIVLHKLRQCFSHTVLFYGVITILMNFSVNGVIF